MAEETKEEEFELMEVDENTSSGNNEENTTDTNTQSQVESDSIEIDEKKEEFVKNKKNNLIKKILIGVVGFLLLILLLGIVLFFMGVFDPPKEEMKPKEEIKTENIKEEKNYKFNINDINTKKLNKQLTLLTNKNKKNQEELDEKIKIENEKKILEEERKKQENLLIEQEEKLAEEKKLLEEKKALLENQKNELETLKQEAVLLKENLLNAQKLLEEEAKAPKPIMVDKEITNNTVEIKDQIEPKAETGFLLLINVAKIKGELYKSYLDKVTEVNPDVLLCRDNKNRIEIYFGPFDNKMLREVIYNKLLDNNFKESYEVELTREEFNKRCKY